MSAQTILEQPKSTITVVYRHTGKRLGSSFEYECIHKTNAPQRIFFNRKQLKEMVLPNCPLMIYPDITIPEYVATVMYSTSPEMPNERVS